MRHRLTKMLAAMNSFKAAIEALPAKISVIRKIEVGLNINPAEAWSIALYSEFDTLDDVKYYATHPDHVAAGKAYRCCEMRVVPAWTTR